MKYFESLVKDLKKLKEKRNIFGIKQSFEDEGVIFEDVITMRRITDLCDLSLCVKIGGCEAITDIRNCTNIGVDYIIPPMIETEYAYEKFKNSIKDAPVNYFFLCETKTAYQNIDLIIQKNNEKRAGVIVGRSDFTKSFGMNKKNVNSHFVTEKIEKIFYKCKNKNIKTTMGGNISYDSLSVIKNLYQKKLLDKIETRNVIVSLNDDNVKNLEYTINDILNFEIKWLEYKFKKYNLIGSTYKKRSDQLKNRI